MSSRTRRGARRIVDSDDDESSVSNTSVAIKQQPPDSDEDDLSILPPTTSRRVTRSRTSLASNVSTSTATTPPTSRATRGRSKKLSMAASEASDVSNMSLAPSETSDTSMAPSEAPDESRMSVDASDEVTMQLQEESQNLHRTAKPRRSTSGAGSELPGLVKSESSPLSTDIGSSPAKPQIKAESSPRASDTANLSMARPPSSQMASPQSPFKPIKAMDTVLERPMDIVLKARTMPQLAVEDNTPKPRIVITYLILNNFKSYAGRQEVGPFHASFSSVVGPNGSGKSNVIDSLLFVFGFRASKMRQGKISALIHNSAQHPNLDHCEVAVHFQEVLDRPGGGSDVVPDSKLIISRKAFKNNSSKYYINDRESNFTTVTTLLRDRGVDLDHKRFLILQGEVESIAQMKAKAGNEHEDGLLEYLEDIIGTSKYKTPIEESATEVETLNDICMEKSGRVQHVEKEKNNLEDKKNLALAYVHDENELALKRAALFQILIANSQDNIAVSEEAIAKISAELNAELEKHHGSEKLIKDLTKAFNKGNAEFEAANEEVQALVKQMTKFEQERVKFDEKRKFLGDKCAKLDKSIENAEQTVAEARETIQVCATDIEARSSTVGDLEAQIQKEEAELGRIRDGLKGKTQAYSDKIAILQKSLEPWIDKINQKQSAIAVAQSEFNMLQEKANAGAVAMAELEAKGKSIRHAGREKEEELRQCQERKAQLEHDVTELEAEYKSLSEQEPRVRAKISNARQKADEARSNLSKSQTQGNVLTALMRMKESGRIDGFHGRLGNLGVIDQKYDVAISTACGALDNFVTDTVEGGQQCIEYLRKTNLGRGNFMCLDKLRVRDMGAIQTPEDAPRLFDLVKPKEPRFRPAFYHALQDTLVATDLVQANRIAYGAKRWRVVTLAGELIDKSGTMSGGGTTVKKGLMSSKMVASTSPDVVAKLEQDRDALETKFQEYQEYMRDLETRLRGVKAEIPQLDTQMQKIGLEIESMSKNLADTARRIKELGKEHQPSDTADNSRMAALEKEIARLNSDIEKLHGETASVEAEIKALQDKIMEVGGEKLRAQRAKVDALKEDISDNNEEISNAEVRKAKAEKQIVKLERDQAKARKELETATHDLDALESEIANQDEIASDLKGRVDEANEALVGRKQELAQLKAELDDKTTELNETRAVEIEMRNNLEQNQKVLAENQRNLKYWEDKLSKLELQNIEDLMGSGPIVVRRSAAKKTKGKKKSRKVAHDEDEDVEMGDADEEEEEEEEEEEDDGEEEDEDEEGEEEDADEGGEVEGEGEEIALSKQPQELPRYSRDELADMSKDTLKREIAALEEKTQEVNVDLAVLAEYRRRVDEHAARSSDLASAVGQRDAAKKRCDDLRRLRLEGFMAGFSTISLRLKEMYQMITMGGNAELELVDSLDPFSEGILFSVMPPKKSWKNISNLSGGEKTLSSLALVFALHHYKPTPLYVMDEIDAALDFRNVSIVANYIKERTKNAQFIVISLRNNMFELAARLVGVYKVNHMTKSVTIENKDYIERRPGRAQAQQLGGSGNQTTLVMR
ncbi:Structural maintenance of chromosomes protein 4 [Ceratocystis lukuohia]|uniref:Structural maintenance of chromosomes protein 4 n=1 Tax=Ceratocystis lukuohia TaxID=2019550 RepID=A0ABR4MH61_9PEZI